ncbi:hypothetical protein OIO90_003395 [Microbotryomycetes sp. JL221]|nr:hypothetical protein OIO90_003395 [Microbotryomycetes sp. JL221]
MAYADTSYDHQPGREHRSEHGNGNHPTTQANGLSVHAPASKIPLGGTRCYWCILTPSLDFAFLDPVLHTHLGAESKLFIGTNLLDYVHPDERDALANDLLPKVGVNGGIEASGVFGSITRCRYSRLPRIRRIFGCVSPETDPDASLYVSDEHFLPLAITTSWIGGGGIEQDAQTGLQLKGAVLAFFHATEDKDEQKDNDESSPSAWTNWCGPRVEDGPYLDERRCQQMVEALSRATGIDPFSPPGGPYPPQHVFQILDHRGQIIVSFPNTGDRYGPEEYAALARGVSTHQKATFEDRTSCTRRYRSKHPIMKSGSLATVDSVVIRYNAITFACFETGGVYFSNAQRRSSEANFTLEDVPRNVDRSSPYKRESAAAVDSNPSGFARRARIGSSAGVELPSLSITTSSPRLQPSAHAYAELHANGGVSPTVASASAILGSFSHQAHEQTPSYQPHPLRQPRSRDDNETHLAPPPPNPPRPTFTAPTAYQLPAPSQGYSLPSLPNANAATFASYPPHPLAQPQSQVPRSDTSDYPVSDQHRVAQHFDLPPRQQHHPNSTGSSAAVGVAASSTSDPGQDSASTEARDKSDIEKAKRKARREANKSKNGPIACQSCGIVNSPEWRKGPDGTKSLCNACGLRYARSVARKTKAAEAELSGVVPKKRGRGKGKKTLEEEAAKKAHIETRSVAPSGKSDVPAADTAAASVPSPGQDRPESLTSAPHHMLQQPASSIPTSLPPMMTTSAPMTQNTNTPMFTPYFTGMPPMQPNFNMGLAHPPAYRLPHVGFDNVDFGHNRIDHFGHGGGAHHDMHSSSVHANHISNVASGHGAEHGSENHHPPHHMWLPQHQPQYGAASYNSWTTSAPPPPHHQSFGTATSPER